MVDINKMFQEKNYEILKRKLNLDINNNVDSLNHTISNYIDLKAIGLNKYLIDMYSNLDIKFKEKDLLVIIENESSKLKEIFLDKIKNRRDKLVEFCQRDIDVIEISDEYLEEYHTFIDTSTKEFRDNIEISIREEVCTNFSKIITNEYKLPDENVKDQLLEYINKSYCNNLIDKVESETELRNSTLKNLSKEAFERFKSMNAKTVD